MENEIKKKKETKSRKKDKTPETPEVAETLAAEIAPEVEAPKTLETPPKYSPEHIKKLLKDYSKYTLRMRGIIK